MPKPSIQVSGREVFFEPHEIIVSKTDIKGRITYANDVFLKISGFGEEELIGQPHNVIRHPDMPRSVFKLLWETIQSGSEIFAYVVNLCKNGDHYWVLAHVTPTFGNDGQIIGYHSNRRVPSRQSVETMSALYRSLRDCETRSTNPKHGLNEAEQLLLAHLHAKNVQYDEFVFSLANQGEQQYV